MNPAGVFLTDTAIVVFGCMGIVAYVKRHLRSLLLELCGTSERASFWLAFSNVALIVVPLIFALEYAPEVNASKSLVFEVAAQLRYGLIGFIVTLSFLAIILLRFIPRNKTRAIAGPPL